MVVWALTETCERVLEIGTGSGFQTGGSWCPWAAPRHGSSLGWWNRDRSVYVETIDRARFVLRVGEHGW